MFDIDVYVYGYVVEVCVYVELLECGFFLFIGLVFLFEVFLGVWVDVVIEIGSDVMGFYDLMIVKVIVFVEDCEIVLVWLDEVLFCMVVLGVEMNIVFLCMLCCNLCVIVGDLDIGFIEFLFLIEL